VTYEKALKASDAQLASSLYATDGVFMPSAAPTSTGTVNIKAAYEYVFSLIQPDIKFTIDSFTIFVENDLAYTTSTSTGTSLLKATGEHVPEINREIFVFKRESGTWKIFKYMFNKASQ
jgi:ketosteroid isomerase-like protein